MVNPRVCISFIDIFRQRGFKVKGEARLILPDDPEFPIKGAELFKKAGNDFKIRSLFFVKIKSVQKILAPSYSIFPDRTVDQQMLNAYKTYGVSPVKSLS